MAENPKKQNRQEREWQRRHQEILEVDPDQTVEQPEEDLSRQPRELLEHRMRLAAFGNIRLLARDTPF